MKNSLAKRDWKEIAVGIAGGVVVIAIAWVACFF